MRNFDADTTTQLEADTAKIFWFLDLVFDSQTYRYSDCDIPLYAGDVAGAPLLFGGDALTFGSDEITFGGGSGINKYEPNGFKISNMRLTADMSIDRATIEFQNVDLIMSGIILNETIVNRTVGIHFGCLNSTNGIIALEHMFTGFVTGWGGMTPRSCPINLGNYFMFWSKRSLRLAQATCPWSFADSANSECGYTGSETNCSKTWTRCRQLDNTDNFGGFRWLPGLEEKRIWWGMNPGDKIQ